jgi:two-component system CitB family sensor kinase
VDEGDSLAVARAVASDDDVVRELAAHTHSPEVQRRAEAVRRRTGVLFVVVADDHGIRYSHPDPSRIGRRVSTAPEALRGGEVVTFERGTLGLSARGKVPVVDGAAHVVGQVSVGIAAGEVSGRVGVLLRGAAGFAAFALALGVVGGAVEPAAHLSGAASGGTP